MIEKVFQINFRVVALLLLGYALLSMQNSFGQATQTFSTSGSFTVPAGVTAITVEVWGGGGAGGGATGNPSAGGGGAGGSYVKNIGYTVIPGNTYTVTVGTGGTGSTTAGASGGDSWFNSNSAILAKGGPGGVLASLNSQSSVGASALTSGNQGSTSPFSYYGGAGGTGGANGASGGGGGGSAGSGSNGNNAVGLTGGPAVLGGGAGANGSSTSGNGTSAANGGGGAGGRANSNTDRRGGSGGNGKVIVSWTCPTYSLSSTSAVSPICISAGSSLITLSSSAAGLPVGSYIVTYSRSAPAATGLTAAMTITTAGTGNFTATGLTTVGSSTITVTAIASEACSNPINTFNTATVNVNALPQVSAFSGNTICSGVAGQLTLTTSSGTGPFVVVYNPGSISKNLVVSGTSFDVSPNPTVTSNYTLVSVTDNYGCVRSSGFTDGTATITVNDPPAITVSPVAPAAVCSGNGTRTISVTATGLGLSYQWLKNGVALTNTAPYSNVTTSILTITNPSITENGANFSVVVTGSCAPTTVTSSPAVALTVNALPIVSNSGISSICAGSTTTLTPTTGGTWVSGSTAIATVNSSGLVTGISVGTVNFTFTQASTGCKSTTPSIIVATTPNPIVEFTQGANDRTANINVCGVIGGGGQNDMDIFSGNPGGSSVIQWQVSIDNGVTWINAPGPTSSSTQYVLDPLYTFYESVAGVYLFRTLITNNACTGISNNITLTVTGISTLTGGDVAGNQSFCSSGNPVAFTQVSASTGGSGLIYQWQSSIDNINFTNIAGATSPVYDASTVSQTTYYRRIVISGGCSKFSNTITVTVNTPIAIIIQPVSSNLCFGSNSSFSITVTGNLPIYQWQSSSTGIGGTYSNLVNSSVYSGVNSSTLNLATPPIGFSSNFYRVLVNGTCGSATSNLLSLKLSNVWMGNISTNWNDPNNWSDGILPSTICSNVLIPNQVYQPTLSSSPEVVINNLIIDPDATLTVANATMKIAGSITNNGSLDVSKGTLDFNGTLPQNISGKLFLDSSIKNLVVSNETGLSLSSTLGRLNITGDLAFGNVNNATLNTGDNLVLASNATATARVTDITNGGVNFGNKFSGKVTVERYFPARRAWRLVTAPISGAGSIFGTWQNNGVFASGKGTYVTGTSANLLTNGMDPSPLNNTSLKFGSALSPITNTITTNLSTATGNSDNKGFFIFVRGDRTPNNLNVNYCNTTTLKSSGILQTGDQQFSATSSLGAFTLIGNPYASPVDFSKLVRTNVNNRFYAWDPYLGNDQGGYVIIDDILNTGIYTSTPTSPGGQTKIIQSSQAVFVVTASAAQASIKFTETAKSSSNLQGLFRPVTGPLFFKTNLYLQNDNGSSSLADGNLIQFDNHFNAGVDMQDAIKLSNVYETIGLANGTTSLAINRRPILASRDTIFLNFSRNRQRKYQFEFVAGKIQRDNLAGFLEDQYLKKLTPLNMDGITKVDFEVSSNPLSAASNRFRVLFNPSVSFNKINAAVKDGDIAIEWEVSDEYNIKSYDIERSRNGVSYTKLDSSLAFGNGKKLVSYSWLDREPLPGYYYYRIRSLSNNGVVGYSKVVKVKMNRSTNDLYVSPNPVTENNIQIQMNKMPPGVYRVRLVSTIGQVLGNYQITHVKNMSKETIHLANRLAPGIYQLEITYSTNKVKKITISVQ